MTKTKKLLYVLLSVIMLIATACCFVGCDSNRENRYDTIVKVIIKKGREKIDEIIFYPEDKQKEITVEYSEEGYSASASYYKFIDNPKYSNDMWFTTSSDMQRDYYGSYIYTNEEGKQIAGDGYPRNLKEKGQYFVNFTSNMAYKEWKFRSITLKINIV